MRIQAVRLRQPPPLLRLAWHRLCSAWPDTTCEQRVNECRPHAVSQARSEWAGKEQGLLMHATWCHLPPFCPSSRSHLIRDAGANVDHHLKGQHHHAASPLA